MENKDYAPYAEISAVIAAASIALDKAEQLLIALMVKNLDMPPEGAKYLFDVLRNTRESKIREENKNE